MSKPTPIRVAAVGYTNTWPLLTRLDRIRYQVSERHPSEAARMLREGEADVGLIPVAAMLSDGDYKVVPGWCIGAEGPVHSVLLVAETPPEEWTAVALDGVSRTSVALSRLMLSKGPLAQRVSPDLQVYDCEPGTSVSRAKGTVAGLVIGDAARSLPDRLTTRLDLGELWWEWTQLPFVFAVWAGRPDLPHEAVQGLRLAASEGMALRDSLPEPDRSYVTKSIRYTLDDRALMGLRRFAALGREAGILGRETPKGRSVDFELYGPPSAMRPRPDLDTLLADCAQGHLPNAEQAQRLHEQAPLTDLALAASLRATALHPQAETPYCMVGQVDATAEAGHVLAQVLELQEKGAATAVLTGERCAAEWLTLLEYLSENSQIALSALDPAQVERLSPGLPHNLLASLQQAGLSALRPGTGWLLDDTVRRRLDAPLGAAQEMAVLRAAIDLDLLPTLRLQFGVSESETQRIAGLMALRSLGAPAVQITTFPIGDVGWQDNTAADQQRMAALARLVLPAGHLVADLQVHGPSAAQVLLHSGLDDFGHVLFDRETGDWDPTLALTELHLREAGREPVRRDLHFHRVGGALTKPAWSADRKRADSRADSRAGA